MCGRSFQGGVETLSTHRWEVLPGRWTLPNSFSPDVSRGVTRDPSLPLVVPGLTVLDSSPSTLCRALLRGTGSTRWDS